MRKEAEQEDLLEQDGPEELYERLSIKVDKGQEPLRLDKFLTARIENITRNKVQKGIEAGRVLVNSKQVSFTEAQQKVKRNFEKVFEAELVND